MENHGDRDENCPRDPKPSSEVYAGFDEDEEAGTDEIGISSETHVHASPVSRHKPKGLCLVANMSIFST